MAILTKARCFIKRPFSSLPSGNALQQLRERCIVQVKGPDSSDLLQGLITNDIHHLHDEVGSMFTMFLNTKGRVLFDAIIYRTEEKDMYLIECDSKASSALQKHLKIYKIKRKVDISNLDSYKVHVLYNANVTGQEPVSDLQVLSGDYDKSLFPESSSDLKIFEQMLIFKDPRVAQLGFRIISKTEGNLQNSITHLIKCDNWDGYKKLRYALGIAEGIEDLPLGNCFPLECNCDYLHGVSFHKGCYIGQELTARTYHTGVIRKRIMPLLFSKLPTILPENNIVLHNDTNLGKLRGLEDNVGLALLRIKQALEFGTIKVGNGEATVVRPKWWPIELPKEKLNVHTNST